MGLPQFHVANQRNVKNGKIYIEAYSLQWVAYNLRYFCLQNMHYRE